MPRAAVTQAASLKKPKSWLQVEVLSASRQRWAAAGSNVMRLASTMLLESMGPLDSTV